jgi:hypothetical protein
MAGEKFLHTDGLGGLIEKESVQEGGTAKAGKIVALTAAGVLHNTMMPTGIGPDTANLVAGEALASGDFVNVYEDGGAIKIRKADATTAGKPANGFILASVAADATGLVYFDGNNSSVTGATPGPVYLSTTPGAFSSNLPTATGNMVQPIGFTTAANIVNFQPGMRVVLS